MTQGEIGARFATVREEIAAARRRAGLPEEGVAIVGVTKLHPPSTLEAALEAGVTDLGENRVQELEEKVSQIGRDRTSWHLIGHLQRNKVRKALPLFDLLHSLDSQRLARELNGEAEKAERDAGVPVLVQVNTSGEQSKYGFAAEEALDAIARICELPRLRVRGLMTMAPLTDDERVLRRTFSEARKLAEEAARQVSGFEAVHLSMGMSNDYRIAVEEGSTMVRLGTVLFGERPA